jgi:hypothetical protein
VLLPLLGTFLAWAPLLLLPVLLATAAAVRR